MENFGFLQGCQGAVGGLVAATPPPSPEHQGLFLPPVRDAWEGADYSGAFGCWPVSGAGWGLG